MVYSLVVRARGLEYGGRELEFRSLRLRPETKLHEERGLPGCRKGLKQLVKQLVYITIKLEITFLKWMVYSLVVRARGLEYGVVSSNPEACTWSRRPNFVRKGSYATGKKNCLKLSHIWLCLWLTLKQKQQSGNFSINRSSGNFSRETYLLFHFPFFTVSKKTFE